MLIKWFYLYKPVDNLLCLNLSNLITNTDLQIYGLISSLCTVYFIVENGHNIIWFTFVFITYDTCYLGLLI